MTSPAAPRESDRVCPECNWACGHADDAGCQNCDALRAELARVQGELQGVEKQAGYWWEIANRQAEETAAQAAQIERLTQELEPLRIRQRRMDIQELRVLIDGYQGTCFPLNRTSLHGLFDEIERQAQKIATIKGLLARLYAWDQMDEPGTDGPYWRGLIEQAVYGPKDAVERKDCDEGPGHMGWLDCESHGAEMRAEAAAVHARLDPAPARDRDCPSGRHEHYGRWTHTVTVRPDLTIAPESLDAAPAEAQG